MYVSAFQQKLCTGVESAAKDDEFKKIKKVLAPFMQTMKRRKRIKTDIIADEHKELYLKNSPKELLLRLEQSYTDPIGITTLLNETGELLKSVTASKCFNLYLTNYARGEIQMVSEYVRKNDRFEQRFPIETGTYMAAHVAHTKEYVISSDILGDVRFSNGIPFAGPTAKAAICIPIITNVQDNCIGVIELYRDHTSPPYDLVHLQICSALTAWMGIAIEQNTVKLNISREVDIHKEITLLSNLYFDRVLSFGKFLSDVLQILKTSVNAEKGGFYLFCQTVTLDSEDTLYADAYEEDVEETNETVLFKKRERVRFVKNEPGLAGYVARKGEIFNIRDAYKDHRFDRKNETSFFRTKSLLLFPIKNNYGVVAVLKMINKQDYPHFRREDIELLEPHLLDLGLVCQHYDLDVAYNKQALKMIEGERLLEYLTKPPAEEMALLKNATQVDASLPPGFNKFDWDTTGYEEDSLHCIAYAILSSDIFESQFDTHKLLDFLLRIKKGHHSVLYHNFEHAFSVFHCIYLMLTKTKDVYTVTECVAMILAALCHDVDHNGVTNSFIILKNDPIFKLHQDFCGEAHRYEVAALLIQASNVLSKFNSQDYEAIMKLLRKLMISLDMGMHMQNRVQVQEILNSDSFNWNDSEHRYYSMTMLLMSADNCANLKNFDVVKKFTANFYKELQHQGDLERAMEFEPLPMLDRSKSDSIPENQIILLNIIVLPVLQVVAALFPNLRALIDLASQTLEKWKEILSMRGQEMWKINQAVVKDRKDKKSHRVSVSRSSSIKTFASESK